MPLGKRVFRRIIANAGREDGVAMIMVLTIIFVMSTLGGIVLLSTLGNVRMSAKYTDWTREYYELDALAEERLQLLDSLLIRAEAYAFGYMSGELYRLDSSVPPVTGDSATELGEKAAHGVYSAWYNGVYSPSLANAGTDAELLDDGVYNSLFPRFNDEYFQRLYYYYAHRLILREIESGSLEAVELTPAMEGFAGMTDGYAAGENGMKVTIDVGDARDEYRKHVTVTAYVTSPRFGYGTESEDAPFRANPVWGNALAAGGSIVFAPGAAAPGAAPGGGQAAAGGQSVAIYGDVTAQDANEYYPDIGGYATLEGNGNGIASDGAQVSIYGNVYSRGDVHVTGSGGSISVYRYQSGFGSEYKKNAYGNTLYMDTSVLPAMIQRYTQAEDGAWDRAFIPFFYRDWLGGNVYCNSLAIEEGADGAFIGVYNGLASPPGGGGSDGAGVGGNDGAGAALAGTVWTLDDVQNSGRDSTISIDGNLIGISSDATFGDHTASSAVINTHWESSRIVLGGAVVMPGTAFMRFDGVNDLFEEDTFFETAESVTAQNSGILRAYMEKPAVEPESIYYYDRFVLNTERGLSDFFLVNYDVLADKVVHLARNLSGRVPDTGIVVGDALEGYARGAIIAEKASGGKVMLGGAEIGDLADYQEIANYAQNYLAYSEIKDSLKAAFSAKTEAFGTSGFTFGDLVDPMAILDSSGAVSADLDGAITYLVGDSELDLSEDRSGIVYCAAPAQGGRPTLTITGDGAFRGAIICEGDIAITGSPTIRHDENLIARIILFYPGAQAFFRPGEMGAASYVRILRVSQAMEKIKSERYALDDWREWQE
ncbi:MAG: hypothetical protein LBL83_09605 [Clostridiales bacterium]|jgi:hypothetical protein|nr:hypothetical protein [Clostridiales bacterium]